MNYLRDIQEVWSYLFQNNKDEMQKVDRTIVIALQLLAPWASIKDPKLLGWAILDGKIFSPFSDQEHVGILEKLQNIESLIPSLDNFFTNVSYFAILANCLKWLTTLSFGEMISMAIQIIFSNNHEAAHQATSQSFDKVLMAISTNLVDRINIGYRSLIFRQRLNGKANTWTR